MRIFISHASEDRNIADRINLSLVKHHDVFFDHAELKGGNDFDDKIREEIKNCELFIFLVSPDSITKPSYALTEMTFAREKWSHPEGHVLPVMVRETSYDLIPPYLSAVTVLEPEGNVVAEVRARVEEWRQGDGNSAGIMPVGKSIRIFTKGVWSPMDTKMEVLWDRKVVGYGSFKTGFDVTIHNVSDEIHTVVLKGLRDYFFERSVEIDPKKMTSNTIELVRGLRSLWDGSYTWKCR